MVKTPVVLCNLIKRLVVEGSHHLCIGRFAVRLPHAQRPSFLLSRGQLVAEGGPLHLQLLHWHRAFDCHLMAMEDGIFHPAHGNVDALLIFILILIRQSLNGITQIDVSHVYHLLARNNCIEHVHILVACSHLNIYWFSIAWELISAHVEPVVRLRCRLSVVKIENDKHLIDSVAFADCGQSVCA